MKTAARLPELDFARAVAITLALGWHFYTPTSYAILDAIQYPGHLIGWAGVDLFFVLSGFLIGGLIFREVEQTGQFNAKRFLIRRAFKIWPVLYLYVALLVVTRRYSPMEIVPQTLFHVQNYWVTPASHLWSLAVEEHFYVLFAVVAAYTGLSRDTVSRVPLVLGVILVATLLLRVGAEALDVQAVSLQIQTQYRADALACGVLLAYLCQFKPDFFERLCSNKLLLSIAVVIGYVVIAMARDDKRFISTIGYSITMVTSAALLLLLYRARPFIAPNIPVRVVAWIGSYSYAIYVFQFVMYRVFEKVWPMVFAAEAPPVALLLMKYAGALVLAVIVTKVVERPLLNLRNRLFPV